jgi:hypothetical protein
LATQNIERNSPPIYDLSPKEQVNDSGSANNLIAQEKYVNQAIAEFLGEQL